MSPIMKQKLRQEDASKDLSEEIEKAIEAPDLSTFQAKVRQPNFDPNMTLDNGYSLLSYAIIKENLHVVRFLVVKGARVDREDAKKTTPLQYASSCNNTDIIEAVRYAGIYQTR